MTTREKFFKVPVMAILTVAFMIIGALLGVVYASVNEDIHENKGNIKDLTVETGEQYRAILDSLDVFGDFRDRSEFRDSIILQDLKDIKELLSDKQDK